MLIMPPLREDVLGFWQNFSSQCFSKTWWSSLLEDVGMPVTIALLWAFGST